MIPLIPHGGLEIAGGSTAQSLTTSAAQMVNWSAASGSNTYAGYGDPAVRPDVTNNRVLLDCPGAPGGNAPNQAYVYLVMITLSGTVDGTIDVTAQLRKNSVVVADLIAKNRWTVSVKNALTLQGILKVQAADNPGTIQTFADPATSATALFAGKGGAPANMTPLDVMLTGSGSQAITVENAQLTVLRIG